MKKSEVRQIADRAFKKFKEGEFIYKDLTDREAYIYKQGFFDGRLHQINDEAERRMEFRKGVPS